jgi:hypothetical protein
MTTRIQYHQIAAKLDYTQLKQKLVLLQNQTPPKTRKSSADVLAPLTDQLRMLRARGWSYAQIAKELGEAGLPIKPSRLRQHLGARTKRARPRVQATPQK